MKSPRCSRTSKQVTTTALAPASPTASRTASAPAAVDRSASTAPRPPPPARARASASASGSCVDQQRARAPRRRRAAQRRRRRPCHSRGRPTARLAHERSGERVAQLGSTRSAGAVPRVTRACQSGMAGQRNVCLADGPTRAERALSRRRPRARRLRLAFVGQSTYFGACALDERLGPDPHGVRRVPRRPRRRADARPAGRLRAARRRRLPARDRAGRRCSPTCARRSSASSPSRSRAATGGGARTGTSRRAAATMARARPRQRRPHRLLRPADRRHRRRVHGGLALAADPGRRPPLPPRPARRRHAADALRRPLDRAPRALPARRRSTASTACTSRSGSRSTSSSELLDAHQIAFNIHNEPYPTLREPRAPAPRRRPPGDLRDAEPDPRARAGHRLSSRSPPRGAARASRRRRAPSPTPFSASACAGARRPSWSAPRASGRRWCATSSRDLRALRHAPRGRRQRRRQPLAGASRRADARAARGAQARADASAHVPRPSGSASWPRWSRSIARSRAAPRWPSEVTADEVRHQPAPGRARSRRRLAGDARAAPAPSHCEDCSHDGHAARRRQRAVAQLVQQRAVAGEQVERPRRPAQVVPVDDEAVLAVRDVLVVAGDRRSSRHVAPMWKASSGGPYIPSTRESLSSTWRSAKQRRPSRRGSARRRRGRRPAAARSRWGETNVTWAGSAHRGDRGERVVDALVHVAARALHDDPQRLALGRRPAPSAARRRRPWRSRCARRARGCPAGSPPTLGHPARLGDEADGQRRGQRRRQLLGRAGRVGRVLQQLHEVGVALRAQLEERRRRLPPGRQRDVAAPRSASSSVSTGTSLSPR